jgi:hypothetical protein
MGDSNTDVEEFNSIQERRTFIVITGKIKIEPDMVAHTYNPINSGGRIQEEQGSRSVWAESL